MPGVQNNATAFVVLKLCRTQYPDVYNGVLQGSGRGWFSYNSGAECTIKKSSSTPDQIAGYQILRACNCLYNAPVWDGIVCSQQGSASQ